MSGSLITYAVQVLELWALDFERARSDVIPGTSRRVVSITLGSTVRRNAQSFIIQANRKIAVFHQLMKRQHRIVRLKQAYLASKSTIPPHTHLYDSFRHLCALKVIARSRSTTNLRQTLGEGRIEKVESIRSGYS